MVCLSRISPFMPSHSTKEVVTQVKQQPSSFNSVSELVSQVGPQTLKLAARRARVNMKDIWMDDVEIDVVLRYLKNVKNYLEWGSGGSTLNFAKFAKERAVSIEHNKLWCRMMPKKIKNANIRPVELHCIENSTNYNAEGNYKQFKEYVDQISKLREPIWNFVLVDGRCRVGAAIKALSYINPKSIVVLHDSERMVRYGSLYQPILNYYDILESIGGLRRRGISVMRRKNTMHYLEGDHEEVQKILEKTFREARYR